jgi:hypothetical protein
MLFQYGESKKSPITFQGTRNVKNIVEFVINNIPNFVSKLNATNLDAFLEGDTTSEKVILLTTKVAAPTLLKALARDLRDISFGFVAKPSDNILGRFGITSKDLPSLVATNVGGLNSAKYSGPLKYKHIKKFIEQRAPTAPKKEARHGEEAHATKPTDLTPDNFQQLCGDAICIVLYCKPTASQEKVMLTQVPFI